MSPIRLVLLAYILVHYSSSTNDLTFQTQPRPVRINNQDIYVINEANYIGQVLYRYDRIQLACECYTEENDIKYSIYWTINNKTISHYNNSNHIQLVMNKTNVKVPVTYVACHCVFYRTNFNKITSYYQYKLYIDLESEPSLEMIRYSVQTSMIKAHVDDFLHRHVVAIVSLAVVMIGITFSLIIFNWSAFR
ncbi:hypothetical protein I4U23_024660 [Adineta vaga]|nr:hypothetical protein I4U23_024660 [Adineta vaga]